MFVVFVEEVAAYGDNGNDDDPFEGAALFLRFVLSLRGGRLGTHVGKNEGTAPSLRGGRSEEITSSLCGASLESTVRFAGIVAVCFVEFGKHDSVGFIGLLY